MTIHLWACVLAIDGATVATPRPGISASPGGPDLPEIPQLKKKPGRTRLWSRAISPL